MMDSTTHILIVDDEPVEGMGLKRAIHRDDPRVRITVVSKAHDVLVAIKEHKYDLIFLDDRIGELTAFDVFPLIEDTPVIFMSRVGNEESAVRALQGGAYDYVIKDREQQYLALLPTRMRNVLDNKRAHTALRESEARYQDLFDHAPDIYILLNGKSTIQSINLAGASQLGWQPVELIGRSVLRMVHPDDVGHVQREILRTFEQSGQLHQLEFRLLHRQGESRLVSARMSVQRRDPKEDPELRMVCRDITAEREAQDREQSLRDRLVRAERLESLAILAGGVAHDLNNVLMPVVAYPDLLLPLFKEGSREYEDVAEIKKSAMAAADIVKDLLTMARRGRCEMSTVQLNEVVQAFEDSALRRDLSTQYPDVTLEVRLAEDLFTVAGSVSHLHKVLMNLVVNAFEAMTEGGHLLITTENRVLEKPVQGYETIPQGPYAVLTVSDSGMGISFKDRARIFEPFYSKKKLGRSGTGLGLSVVYGVLKDHDAFVDVLAGPQSGTQFVVYLPSGSVEEEAMDEKDIETDFTGKEHILIVDDLPEQREVVSRLLIRFGYEVATATNGREAVEMCSTPAVKKAPYDLILLDMIMEEDFDGLDSFRALRALNPDQKCILVSGYAETERVNQALEEGVCSFIKKPYTMHLLGRRVREALRGRKKTPLQE